MKQSIITTLLTLGTLWVAGPVGFANPVVGDDSQRRAEMIAEDVQIHVQPKVSQVIGSYTFRQQPDDTPEKKDTHVLLYVPVLFPDFRYEKVEQPPPTVTVNGVNIPRRIWDDLTLEGDPTPKISRRLKSGGVVAYQYPVPLRMVSETFIVRVSYRQINFPGEVAVYMPIDPPKAPGSARITFIAEKGFALKPYSARFWWNRSRPTVSLPPKSYELMRVKNVIDGGHE